MMRKRAWHEPEPSVRRALRGLLRAAVGIGLPIVALLYVITANTPKPPDQPPPPSLREAAAATVAGDLDGTWAVADGSWVGYRIIEEIPRLKGEHEVVARSTDVTGRVVIDGTAIERAHVTVDLRGLESDRPWRDQALRKRYLHINRYPTAAFALREPLHLVSPPELGRRGELTLPGELTLHGVTRRTSVPLQVRWDGDRIHAVGRLHVVLADHDISPPRIPGFRFVDFEGDIELDLVLAPAGRR